MTRAANAPWTWIAQHTINAIHDEQLAEHGGLPGLRDASMLESAMARPQQLAAYGEPDLAALAASYGFGVAKNHPFVDGNKRTAFVAVELCLALNGGELLADDVACTMTMLALAAGELDEAAFAEWFRRNSARR